MKAKLLLIIAAALASGCAPRKQVYKVTFRNGDVDYYELDYRPKRGDSSIRYNGDTIIGVENIEKF